MSRLAVSKERGVCERNFSMMRSSGEADDPFVGAGHPGVGQVRRAAGQDRLVGRRHVRVRADDGGDAPVEVPADRLLLGGRLGVHVHEDDLDVARARPAPRRRRGTGESALAGMKTWPWRFRTPTGIPAAVDWTVKPAPGIARRVVGRPQQAVRGVQRVVDLLLVPDVVAGGEDVDRHLGELVEELVRQRRIPRPRSRC